MDNIKIANSTAEQEAVKNYKPNHKVIDFIKFFNSIDEYEAVKNTLKNNENFVVLDKETGDVVYSNLLEINESDLDTSEYIDLGLPSGLKWASCNLGAVKPCDYGLLYQWGRVDGYAYGDENNQFRTLNQNKQDTGNEEIPATTSGKIYGLNEILDPADDAAYVATNGKAHMPTDADIIELLGGTTHQWCIYITLGKDHTKHTIQGRLFTSKTNGKKIFIPAAGMATPRGNSVIFHERSNYSGVWASSSYPKYISFADRLQFTSGFTGNNFSSRCMGHSIRPVQI